MASNARESRRRKILERGADRLALISGRSHSIPSADKPLADSPPLPPLSAHFSASPNGGDGEISSELPTNDSIIDSSHIVEPPLSTPETTIQTTRTPASDINNNAKSSLTSSTGPRSTTQAAGGVQLLEHLFSNRFVTPSQITSAIAATGSTRLLCSVIIAIFVVLSNLGFPLLGSKIIKNILCYRPLYFVLLTNLTLVLAKLLFNNQRSFHRVAGESNGSSVQFDWAEQAGNALEVGLLLKKAIDAVVMDCSVYAIIVVAGFCILH